MIAHAINAPTLKYSGMNPCEPFTVPGYTIRNYLGRGGFGRVYLATRKSDGLEVCLKQIQHSNERYSSEVKIFSELSNRFVVKYYESFSDARNLYIMMEYAKDGCLDQMIKV